MEEKESLQTKVKHINGRWHCRLISPAGVVDEMACKLKQDVGWCCSEMLRWYDKCGGVSKMADASRSRQKRSVEPAGKVWYKNQLPVKERKHKDK